MNDSTRLEELAAHYDATDTTADLRAATAAGPEVPPAGEPMTTFAVRLPIAVLNHIRDVAGERGVTTSEVIRNWIDAGLAAEAHGIDERSVPVRDLLSLIGRATPRREAG